MVPYPPTEGALNLALALVESSTLPVLLLDREMKIVSGSASFCSAFQIDPFEMGNRPLAELGAGEWNVPQLAGLLRATASGFAEIKDYEVNLIREGHSNLCLVVNAKKLHYAGATDVNLILSIADVTEARVAERLKDDLVREKDMLLKELHHRIANSLQLIASVLMQSARQVLSEETRGHLYNAHQRVMSVAALQQQLACSEPGDLEIRPYFVALCDSIGASMIPDHDQLSLEVTADDSITTADRLVGLGLIVTELVINALKHAFPDNRRGKIWVDYRSSGTSWTLSVRDDGVGMCDDPSDPKSGLGTSIVQALAKQLGAEINVRQAHPGTGVSIAHTTRFALVTKAAV